MKEIHGVVCKAIKHTIHADDEVSVRVYDGDSFVGLVFSHENRNPKLTVEEALFLAKQLYAAAKRLKSKATT